MTMFTPQTACEMQDTQSECECPIVPTLPLIKSTPGGATGLTPEGFLPPKYIRNRWSNTSGLAMFHVCVCVRGRQRESNTEREREERERERQAGRQAWRERSLAIFPVSFV